jgi:hypothetical protein
MISTAHKKHASLEERDAFCLFSCSWVFPVQTGLIGFYDFDYNGFFRFPTILVSSSPY